jgi:hypothetical protein
MFDVAYAPPPPPPPPADVGALVTVATSWKPGSARSTCDRSFQCLRGIMCVHARCLGACVLLWNVFSHAWRALQWAGLRTPT